MNRKKTPTFILVLIAVLGMYFSYDIWKRYRWQNVVPAQLSVWPASHYGSYGFREYWGGAIFTVKKETLEAVKSQGLDYLNKDLKQRAYLQCRPKSRERFCVYAQWQMTPGKRYSGFSYGVSAILDESSDLLSQIRRAREEEGSFYTYTNAGAGLLLIPDLGILVFGFRD